MDELTTRSTSKASALVSDVILRETDTTRLVFRPMLVDNAKAPAAAVKGTFVFQRKSPKTNWEDVPHLPLSSLKGGEGYQLALDSAETFKLYTDLMALYQLFEKEGIPIGETEFVRAKGALLSLSDLPEDRLQAFLDANTMVGSDFIKRLLAWATSAHELPKLVQLLERLGPTALANLNTAVSVSALTEAMALWEREKGNDSEQFWHDVLVERSFLLEQLFSWPLTIISDKAYLGGKSVQNTGGKVVDFLVKNRLTKGAALVEIKTPATKLTGRDYRPTIPNISSELAGGIVQLQAYKASLIDSYRILQPSSPEYEVFDPPCALIIGDTGELNSPERRRTFELFRHRLNGISVITFDEFFERVQQLFTVLQSRVSGDPTTVSNI